MAVAAGDQLELERLDREAAVTFGDPASRLVVYGTLRPGGRNHHLVADLGTWSPATLRGTLGSWSGYPTFTPGPEGSVPANLLTAPDLSRHHARLDAFEGDAYRRELVVAQTEAGVVVAQCYVDAST